MKQIRRPGDRPARSRVARLAAVSTFLVLPGLTGCSFVSPQTTASPYDPSDGTNGSITDPATGSTVDLRNMLLIAAEEGGPGTLIGVLDNDGSTVPVQFVIRDAEGRDLGTGTVRATSGELTRIGFDGGPQVRVGSVPVLPGSTLVLEARTAPGGAETLTLPVFPPVGPYADLGPSAEPSSPSSSSSPGASGPSPSGSPSASGSAGSESGSSESSPSPTAG